MKLYPGYGRIIVLAAETEEVMETGLIITDNANDGIVTKAKVVKGCTPNDEHDKFPTIDKGETVWFNTRLGTPVTFDGVKHIVVSAGDVLALLGAE
jgi:co-chaperonin GroES (HSP10)